MFRKLMNLENAIIFLQETHSTEQMERVWQNQWPEKIFFAHGTSKSRGVAILYKNVECSIINTKSDENGRYIIQDIKIENKIFTLVSIYAPTRNYETDQISLIILVSQEFTIF